METDETDETDFDAFDADNATWPNITSVTIDNFIINGPIRQFIAGGPIRKGDLVFYKDGVVTVSDTVLWNRISKSAWRRHRRARFAQKREANRKFVLTLTKKRSTSPDVTLPNQNRT